MQKFYILLFFFILSANSIWAQNRAPLRLRIMTYNLRYGELASLTELAEHIKAFKPDFVALQEVDSKTERANALPQKGKDFISELGYRTEMFPLYGKAINFSNGYYGIGILSKYPYFKMEKVMLTRPLKKEQRVMLQAYYEVGVQDTVVFASTHLDFFSENTRYLQIKQITDTLENTNYPVILGGDFNAEPNSKAIRKGMRSWKLLTDDEPSFPSTEPQIKIDYLFGYPKEDWQIVRTQTVQSLLSDHLPIITEVELKRKE